METDARKVDTDGNGVAVLQLTRASGEILELPAVGPYGQTSFVMLLDNWHQFEARQDDVWLFGYPRSG